MLWFLAGFGAIAALIAFGDKEIHVWMISLDGPLIGVLRDVTQIGNARWYLVGFPIIAALALWLRRRAAGQRALALDGIVGAAAFLFAAVALSGIFTNLIKWTVGRARPDLLDQAGVYGVEPFSLDHDFQSFPSGHATTLFALAAALGCLAPRWRAPLYALATLLAMSRTALGAHYPSDLVGGAIAGISTAMLLRRFLAAHGLLFRETSGGPVPQPSLRALAEMLRRRQSRKAAR